MTGFLVVKSDSLAIYISSSYGLLIIHAKVAIILPANHMLRPAHESWIQHTQSSVTDWHPDKAEHTFPRSFMAMLDLRPQFYRNLTELQVISKNGQTESFRWYMASFECESTTADFQNKDSTAQYIICSFQLLWIAPSVIFINIGGNIGLVTSELHHDRASAVHPESMVAVIAHLLSKSTTPVLLGARTLSPTRLT